MVTDEQDRIRLAAWQGLFKSDPDIETVNGIPQKRSVRAWLKRPGKCLPDPKHDPADCEALINHIVERNYMFSEHRWAEDGKTVYRLVFTPRTPGDSTQGEYDDRGTGVVELALKVMDDA